MRAQTHCQRKNQCETNTGFSSTAKNILQHMIGVRRRKGKVYAYTFSTLTFTQIEGEKKFVSYTIEIPHLFSDLLLFINSFCVGGNHGWASINDESVCVFHSKWVFPTLLKYVFTCWLVWSDIIVVSQSVSPKVRTFSRHTALKCVSEWKYVCSANDSPD